MRLDNACAADEYLVGYHARVVTAVGGHGCDAVDDVHSVNDPSECGIVAVKRLAAVVETDKELRGSGVEAVGVAAAACHRENALFVRYLVVNACRAEFAGYVLL